MMRWRNWLVIPIGVLGFLVAFLSFQAWRQSSTSPGPGVRHTPLKTTLYLGWLYSGAYAGEALAATDFDTQCNLELKLQPGGLGLDPIRLVSNGSFGVSSADEVLKVVANNNLPLVIVGVLNDESPAVFLTLASSGVTEPHGFVGRRVGMLPFGSTRLIYLSLLKRLSIDPAAIREVPVGADLRPFIAGTTHDVQPAYAYDETVTLDQQGVGYNVIRPADYGVTFKGPVYFTTRKTVESEPALLDAFLCATSRGWREAEKQPSRGVAALKELSPSVDSGRELQVLQRALPYYFSKERQLFDSDPQTWRPMIAALREFMILDRDVDPNSILELSRARVASAQ